MSDIATKPEPILWLLDARGIYIPRDFATSLRDRNMVRGVSADDWDILENGPDDEFYWETWDHVLNSAIVNDGETDYYLYQEGDLWLVPSDMQWSDEHGFFRYEDI